MTDKMAVESKFAQDPRTQPILNTAYSKPQWHWKLDPDSLVSTS